MGDGMQGMKQSPSPVISDFSTSAPGSFFVLSQFMPPGVDFSIILAERFTVRQIFLHENEVKKFDVGERQK